jgi:hypothetical protein
MIKISTLCYLCAKIACCLSWFSPFDTRAAASKMQLTASRKYPPFFCKLRSSSEFTKEITSYVWRFQQSRFRHIFMWTSFLTMADIITSVNIHLSSGITLHDSAGQTNRIQSSRLKYCGSKCDFNIMFDVKWVADLNKSKSDAYILATPLLWMCVWVCALLLVFVRVLATEKYGQ